jgi:WD40 repeat protein
MAFSPDCRLFACHTDANVIDIWNVSMLLASLSGHNGRKMVKCFTVSLDGRFLAFVFGDGSVRVWAKGSKAFRFLLAAPFSSARALALSPNGARLAMLSENGTVNVLCIPEGDCALTLRDASYRSLAFSPDSQLLALAKWGGHIDVYNFHDEGLSEAPQAANLRGVLAISPDGEVMAGADMSNVILYRGRHWDACQKLPLFCTYAVAFSPDGRRMAVAAYSIIRLLDMTEGGNVYAELSPGHKIKRMAFSGDGSELITDHGLLAVPGDADALPMSASDTLPHFYVRDEWVSFRSRNILWLPPDCRAPKRRIMRGNILARIDDNGDVHHVEFDPAQMTAVVEWPATETACCKWERPGNLIEALAEFVKSAFVRSPGFAPPDPIE